MNGFVKMTYRKARWVVIVVTGFAVLIVGVVMIVMPGPAFLVIPLGLAILAVEFVWARKLLKKVKQQVRRVTHPSETAAERARNSDPHPRP